MAFITLDFETFYRSKKNIGTPGEKFSLKGLTYEEYIRDPRFKVHGVGIKIDNQPTYWLTKDIKTALSQLFYEGNEHTLLAHNTMFDGAILSWYYGLAAKTYYCTQALSQMLWASYPATLKALTKRLFPDDPSKWKGEGLEVTDGYAQLNAEQDEILGGYCIQDVEGTFESFRAIFNYLPPDELRILDMTLKMFIHPTLVLDRQKVEEHNQALKEDLDTKIANSGLSKTLLSSNPQFAEWLKTTHGIEIPIISSPTAKNPDNTKLALAKDDLEFMQIRMDHPELQHIWDARIAIKSTIERSRGPRLLSHAEKSHINPEGTLAVPLKYCGAHTGRWSGTNKVNFQNFKQNSPLRLALCAPKGHMLIVRDLSNIEGRMNAWFHGQQDLLEIFAAGGDIYNDMASTIYKRPIDRKRVAIDENGKEYYPDGVEGFVGKTACLGLGYGMGAEKFLSTLLKDQIPVDANFARQVVNTYRTKNYKIQAGWRQADRYIFDMAKPKLDPYTVKCVQIEKGRVRLPSGRYINYPELHLEETEYGRNFEYWNGQFRKSLYGGLWVENVIQALSRDVMAAMMLSIEDRLKQHNIKTVLTVHDEIIIQAANRHTDRCFEIMGEVMSTPPEWCNDGTLTLASEGGIAKNYSK